MNTNDKTTPHGAEYGARWQPVANQLLAERETLLQSIDDASRGETVYRVMSPDGLAYCIEFSHSNSIDPRGDCERWLRDQQSRGLYLDYYTLQTTRLVSAERTLRTVRPVLDDAIARVADLSARLDKCEKFIHSVRVVYFLDGGKDTEFLQRLLGEVE